MLVNSAACAQQAPAQTSETTVPPGTNAAATTAPAPDQPGIADIVVTAQRREENLQHAAIAVSAVAGDTLTRQSISQAADLTRLLPAVQIAPASSFTQIYVRGVGTFGANAFAEQGVAFNLDGVYLSRPAAPAGVFYDLERVELLKGPQGTLYGRNSTGGALNVITHKPVLNDNSGFATLEYGNYNTLKTTGAINLGVGDHLAVRVAGQHAAHDGYYNDGYDDEDTDAVRVQVRGDTLNGLDATLSFDYARVGGKGPGGTILPLLFDPGGTRLGPSDPRVLADYLARGPTAPVPQIVARADGYQDNRFVGVYATINADLGFAKLTVIPAFRQTDLDFVNYSTGYLIDVDDHAKQVSGEARLAGKTGPLNWVLGAYVFGEDTHGNQLYSQASSGTFVRTRLSTDSFAFFGQGTYSLTDRFRLTGGVRYTQDHKIQNSFAQSLPFVGFVTPAFPNFTPIIATISSNPQSNVTFRKATWKAGVEYDLAPRSLLYASVSTGFKSGILFSAVGNNTSRPETLTAYTLGSKNRFLDNRLQINVEGFYWDYKDQQISGLGPVQVGSSAAGPLYGPVFLTQNAGAATLYGAEIETVFQPTRADQFSFDIQYLHSRYDDLRYQYYSTAGSAPVVGCPTQLTSLAGTTAAARIYAVDCSGRPLVNAPRWAANAGYEHRFELGGSGRVTFAVDTRLETSRYLSLDYLPLGRQSRYSTTNLRLTYAPPRDRFELTGFVNNVENTLIYSNSLQSPVKAGTLYNLIRPPRTYGIRGTVRF
jgi:iron complex outermembrane receptor protein